MARIVFLYSHVLLAVLQKLRLLQASQFSSSLEQLKHFPHPLILNYYLDFVCYFTLYRQPNHSPLQAGTLLDGVEWVLAKTKQYPSHYMSTLTINHSSDTWERGREIGLGVSFNYSESLENGCFFVPTIFNVLQCCLQIIRLRYKLKIYNNGSLKVKNIFYAHFAFQFAIFNWQISRKFDLFFLTKYSMSKFIGQIKFPTIPVVQISLRAIRQDRFNLFVPSEKRITIPLERYAQNGKEIFRKQENNSVQR